MTVARTLAAAALAAALATSGRAADVPGSPAAPAAGSGPSTLASPPPAAPDPAANQAGEGRGGPATAPRAGDRAICAAQAPVTILVYMSLTFYAAHRFEVRTLPALHARYLDTGRVRLVYRDYPLDRVALAASTLGRCISPPQQSLAFIHALLRDQEKWVGSGRTVADLLAIAATFGLPQAAARRCLANLDVMESIVLTAKEAADRFGVDTTVTLLVGPDRLSGAPRIEAIATLLDPLLH